MKLTTFAIALSFSVASLQAVAQNVVLKPVNDNFETQVCYTAATEGYAKAKQLIRSTHSSALEFTASISCNGEPLKVFAKKYANNVISDNPTTIKLIAKDSDDVSKACVEAVTIGEASARAKFNLEGEKIFCNYKEMGEFVRKYDSERVSVRAVTEE
jgi:hypothetical protein